MLGRVGALLVAVGAGLVPACAIRPRDPAIAGTAGTGAIVDPFAPATLRLTPLTRIARDERGEPVVVAHVELLDAWGDTTKGVGTVQVQLYRPLGGPDSGLGAQELTWDIDLRDLERNQLLWDAATRTYRLQLERPPAWVSEGRSRARLRAVMTTRDGRGAARVIADEYEVQ